ncbi:MAG: ribosome small subunit-dependent GTPase A [Chitinophagales bacterium]
MKARVLKSMGKWYLVRSEATNEVFRCRLVGKMRLEDIKTTNPVAVGDWVMVQKHPQLLEGEITEVLERNNYIIRQSPHRKHLRHVIAANLDQAMLIITFSKPRTSLGFIDRFLITAEMYHIPTILVFNKADIYKPKDLAKYERAKAVYEALGYTCFLTSAITGQGNEDLQNAIANKTTLLAGHSGVGKSSLINRIAELELETKQISEKYNKGVHTTTFAAMYELPFGGDVIDTPGIKQFGVVHIEPEEVGHYFPEIRNRLGDCKFSNCLHENEPDCAVIAAFAEEIIAEERYINYLKVLEDVKSVNYWER